MVRVAKPGPKRAKSAGKYAYQDYRVELGPKGEITVKPGDSVSKYAACLFGDPMVGWDEFGRFTNGHISPLIDPSKIRAGEVLYHLPSAGKPAISALPPGEIATLSGTELDIVGLHRFFNGVAARVAMAGSARIKWNAEKGSFWKSYRAELYNLSLGNFFDEIKVEWSPPSAEVVTGSKPVIAEETEKLRQHYWETFLTKTVESPQRGVQYLRGLEKVKQSAADNLRQIFNDAKNINQDILDEINFGLRIVAGTKAVSNISVVVLGTILSGGAPIAIGLAQGAATFYIQFKQGASAFEKTSTVVVTTGGAYTAAWQQSLQHVANTKASEAAKISELLVKADQSSAQRLSNALMLEKRMIDAERAAFKASLHNAVGKGLAAFAIGMEVYDFAKIWNDTSN